MTTDPTDPQATPPVGRPIWVPRLGAGEGLGIGCLLLVIGLAVLLLAVDATGDLLYQQNEFVICLLFFAALVAADEAGYRLGRGTPAQASEETKTQTNQIQTAVFAVLGLLLAFTFSMAVSRFDARKQALVEETNALGTTYLRTQLLPEPQRTAEVALLRHYVDARLASARPTWYRDVTLKTQTSDLQQRMWSQAVSAAQQDPRSIPTGLFVQSLNDAIDAQGRRDAARLNYLPGSALYLLFAASILAMGILGYRSGLGGRGRSALGTVMLALVIALVVLIILDFDHPYQGLITISQQNMIDLRQSMGTGAPGP
jgi:hypothetical protein